VVCAGAGTALNASSEKPDLYDQANHYPLPLQEWITVSQHGLEDRGSGRL
jgi:hypothetical protein